MSEKKVNQEFVPFKETKIIHEMGFKTKNYFAHYKGERGSLSDGDPSKHRDTVKRIGAPLWQQAFEFFAKEYRLDIYIYKNDDGEYYPVVRDKSISHYNDTIPEKYNDARITGIRKLIELAKKKET